MYRMQILNNAIGDLARESLARTGLSPEQCEQRFLEILDSAKEFAPPPQHPNLDAEVRDILKDAEKLEKLLDGYMN